MITILSALVSLLSVRVRSRASLELELVARRRSRETRSDTGDRPAASAQRPASALLHRRLLWVWLYQVWPQILNAMVLVKPATVIQWHRKGFRLYWRWRPRHLGRPKMNSETRELIRQMSVANPPMSIPWPQPCSSLCTSTLRMPLERTPRWISSSGHLRTATAGQFP